MQSSWELKSADVLVGKIGQGLFLVAGSKEHSMTCAHTAPAAGTEVSKVLLCAMVGFLLVF